MPAMKITWKAIVIGVVVGGVVSFGLGLLDGMVRTRGGGPGLSEGVRLGISVGLAAVTMFIVAALSGNKALTFASGAEDKHAKGFAPDPARGVIYLFRDAFVGKLAGIDVFVDGRPVAQTRGKTFLRLELPPGYHVLTSASHAQGTRVDLPLTIAPGTIAYVEQGIRMGAVSSGPSMALKGDVESQNRIRRCRLLAVAPLS
jgi:hypothetical protein